MKKFLVMLLVLVLAVFSLDAASGGNSATLTIKAYKKSKGSGKLTVKVIDALTGSLDDIFNTDEVNNAIIINDYVNKFIGDMTDTTGINRKAIFSVHVAGNMTGSFSVTVTFSPLRRYTASSQSDYTNNSGSEYYEKVMIKGSDTYWVTSSSADVIPVTYYMKDINYFFTATGTTTGASNTDEISCNTQEASKKVPADNSSDSTSLSFAWTVSGSGSSYWDMETMFAMIIDQSGYDSVKGSGTFMAPIEIVISAS